MNSNNQKQIALDLIDFIGRSPTPFHVVKQATEILDASGYQLINEGDILQPGRQYFAIRNDSSLIAISLNEPLSKGFHMVGAHTDSPCLKIKPNAAYENIGYLQLGVEVYGGALLSPWFDRDLSLAGRVTALDVHGRLVSRLIDFKKPIGVIPSLAIHLNREANDKNAINKQKHLPPILNLTEEAPDLHSLLLKQLKQLKQEYPTEQYEAILAYELNLYDTQAPAIIGLEENLVASARLDNLLSSYIALRAMLKRKPKTNAIVVLSDHEEVGSTTASGAAGPFLESVLRQICEDEQTFRRAMSQSFLISADNAHAVHPNFPDQHEPRHQPKLNKGLVIKINHNQRYATNSETNALFAQICESAAVPYVQYVVRSDMGCGSTIGPITAAELGVRTVDIGVPQLAMHSIRELAGVDDCNHLMKALTAFFNPPSKSR